MILSVREEYYGALEAAGHCLVRNEDGTVDRFQLDVDNHNGPGCERCGESWCELCVIPDIDPCTGVNNHKVASAAAQAEMAEVRRRADMFDELVAGLSGMVSLVELMLKAEGAWPDAECFAAGSFHLPVARALLAKSKQPQGDKS